MKKIICILLAVAVLLPGCAGAAPQETKGQWKNDVTDLMDEIAARPVDAIGVQLQESAVMDLFLNLSRRSAGEGNMLVSPLSVLAALAMTANGAKGETLAQMEDVLGMEAAQLNIWMHSYIQSLEDSKALKLANSIWFTQKQHFAPVKSFLQTNADYYGAGIYQAPFDRSTVNAINGWVEEHTDGMIKNVLDEIPEEAVMYLINALAFEAAWQEVYNEFQVRDSVFTLQDGTESEVTLMYSEEHAYLEDPWATGFLKYYEGGDYAFAALLPKEGITTKEYLNQVTGQGLYDLLADPADVTVYAAIPKFEMEYSVEMSDVLTAMGMVDAFQGDRADLSGLGSSTEGNLYISRVLHKTAIQVAEQGTKAGAATMVEVAAEGAYEPQEVKEVILDRPFVYMLIDCNSGLPFFVGTMEDPLQTTNELEPGTDEPMPILREPPQLQLYCGDETASVGPSNYSWDHYVSEDERSNVIACGAHPLQFKSYTTLQPLGKNVTFSFEAMPDSWELTCWSAEDRQDPMANTVAVTKTENGFIPNEGDHIYAISATWDTPQYSGTAEYVFKVGG